METFRGTSLFDLKNGMFVSARPGCSQILKNYASMALREDWLDITCQGSLYDTLVC